MQTRIATPYDGFLTKFVEIKDADGRFVAFVGGFGGDVTTTAVRELIATPALLRAANLLLKAWDSLGEDGPQPMDDLIADLRSAAAKMEGR
jgi:hypothetical protein